MFEGTYFFHFHQFQYNTTNNFGKNYLNAKLQVGERVTDSGGLHFPGLNFQSIFIETCFFLNYILDNF